jgi:hypothetical protein
VGDIGYENVRLKMIQASTLGLEGHEDGAITWNHDRHHDRLANDGVAIPCGQGRDI